MSEKPDPMDKFNFLIGKWHLHYNIPKSSMSPADTGSGTGEFKRILNDKFVQFEYYAEVSAGSGGARGIFAWDDKAKLYRYWWFETSGAFMEATCNFIDENTLRMLWHNSLLVQSFKKIDENKVVLRMSTAQGESDFELVLEVVFSRE